ncbi:MAG: phosphopyruvate hydratase [Rhodospirillaceae bacterium]|nr:phosphopyruvate hydratase [Rhodospirillaceae bacterium]MBT5300096.1 phosphopyruvate hydratase [Rhodospirillaceae bacterium]MBT5513635.1 phosphopyruvate hydratase [Rhodospirillaceae bacterium]MBT6087420.1 phosphopyruvate hydratase [Rhodospirillaceae bacterium]MBT6608736.1 phosphopyruvate hydratase [Rhodospirillaceae bacterium]
MSKNIIKRVHARRVWDSRGRPTIEVDVTLRYGAMGRAIAPAGASTGAAEAVELRDGGASQGGYDVLGALGAVNDEINTALKGMDVRDQAAIDRMLIELDGTENKSRLGANALIATSMAVAHAAAAAEKLPLWQYLGPFGGGSAGEQLPLPEIQILGGGAHAAGRVDVQDFMVIAVGADSFAQALDWTADVYRAAGSLLADSGRLQGVADEGGFWPAFHSNEEGLEILCRAIEAAGRTPGQDIAISLDIAASEFGADGRYRMVLDDRELDSDGLSGLLVDWVERYPIVSIEDPLGEDDPEGLARFTWAVGKRVQVVGDDFLVTNADKVLDAAKRKACNAVLIKPNQAGTLSETKASFDAANDIGFGAIISARSGETEDATIVHLGVGWGVKQLKVGSFARSERMVKWNEGLRIAEAISSASGDDLPLDGTLPPRDAFPWK